VYSLVGCYTPPVVFPALRQLSSPLPFRFLRMEPLPRGGGFALPEVCSVPEVVVVALELDGLALGAVGAPPFVETAFLAPPSLLFVARPIHNWVCDATAHALLSASWALTMGGLSCRTRTSPIQFQAGFILDRYLPRLLQLVSVIGHRLNYYVGSHELRL